MSMSKLVGATRRLLTGVNKLAPAVLQVQQNRTIVHKSLLRFVYLVLELCYTSSGGFIE